MDEQFTARICLIAMQAKKSGYEDVSAWMQKHLTQDTLRDAERSRKNRKRGVKVRLAPRGGGSGPVAILDAARVRELIEEQSA